MASADEAAVRVTVAEVGAGGVVSALLRGLWFLGRFVLGLLFPE